MNAGDSDSSTFAINSALNLLPGAGLTFVNVGDIQTALLGTVQSNEDPGFASGVVNGETDTLSMQIAVILGGQTFTFNLLSPDLGVSATGSIVASTAANNIVFTSGSSYSTVQQILSDGINYYTIGAIIQWSDNGTSGWGNSQTISYQDIDTYRISMELLALQPVNPNPEPIPEPATLAFVGAGLLALYARRRWSNR